MKKPFIPSASQPEQSMAAMKANLDVITGRVGGEINLLNQNATNIEIINKINEIANKLNASTK